MSPAYDQTAKKDFPVDPRGQGRKNGLSRMRHLACNAFLCEVLYAAPDKEERNAEQGV